MWHHVEHDEEDEDEDQDEDELEDADLAVLAKHGLTREDFHNLVRLATKLLPCPSIVAFQICSACMPRLSTAMAWQRAEPQRATPSNVSNWNCRPAQQMGHTSTLHM